MLTSQPASTCLRLCFVNSTFGVLRVAVNQAFVKMGLTGSEANSRSQDANPHLIRHSRHDPRREDASPVCRRSHPLRRSDGGVQAGGVPHHPPAPTRCRDLFTAVARSKPRLHCFGHIHDGWGAKMVAWRPDTSAEPSHLADIDNDASVIVELLGSMRRSRFYTTDTAVLKEEKVRRHVERRCCGTSHGHDDEYPLVAGKQTLFVNASVKGDEEIPTQLKWLVDLELPRADADGGEQRSQCCW